VCLVGPPNAGKSSVLNRLAGREAAIVAPTAGTTRDLLHVALDLGGYKVKCF
jgi:tRNA modification GTPase